MLVDFEVIEIFDENNPHLVLLGIDWSTNMNGIINLKKHNMIFEKRSLQIVVSLDLVEGSHYTEPVRDDKRNNNLDCIYKITT